MCHLSLIIPLFNEEGCLKKNFETIKAYLDTLGKDYEIVLVDDGSTDSTASIIERIVKTTPQAGSLNSPRNKGKGHAVRLGVLSAVGQYIVFVDADLAVPVRFIGTCMKELESGTPIVIGSRHLPGSSLRVREGPLRQVFGEAFRRLAKLGLGLRVSDVTCGAKGFRKKAARDIFSRSMIDRWGYDAEIIFLSQKLGYTIKEFPVHWSHSFESKVNVGIDSLRTLMEMFRVYYYYLRKQYKL